MDSGKQIERWRLRVEGLVQGVGFRPYIYRIARESGLGGWVKNDSSGVIIEAEGESRNLEDFFRKIYDEKPVLAEIYRLEKTVIDNCGGSEFSILKSDSDEDKTALVLPDTAICGDCLREIFDSSDRRYLYPFTNCTNCGPRYSIITGIPYDRKNTTMAKFAMCPECRAEYENPADRRFHAQPNACPKCGPEMELWDGGGNVIARRGEAMVEAAEVIKAGKIMALKGLGGFQLAVDARNEEAVRELRKRKRRPDKAFAVMMKDIEDVRRECEASWEEERLLASHQAPIVLIKQKECGKICVDVVNPGNPYLGVMLPYTPMHHILMRELGTPIVATSGNLSEEPICIDEREALAKMGKIADYYLVHNRPIKRPVDDSVAIVIFGETTMIRRARGYAPLPIILPDGVDWGQKAVISVGGHQKNTTALGFGNKVFVSQHIGDLENTETYNCFRNAIGDLQALFEKKPEGIECDIHPDYLSTKFAFEQGIPVHKVQHHYAHILSCMAENNVMGKVLGVAFDGTGYGTDGTIWGGEFLAADYSGFRRVGHLRKFRLPGGEKAAMEPIRCALGVLFEILGGEAAAQFDKSPLPPLSLRGEIQSPPPRLWEKGGETVDCGEAAGQMGGGEAVGQGEIRNWAAMLEKGLNCPWTSSAGRLFDAAAAILGIRYRCSFEGQGAMELEFAAKGDLSLYYSMDLREENGMTVLDWEAMVREMSTDVKNNISAGVMAMKFHLGMVEGIVKMAEKAGCEQVCLTGGCFQNRLLTELTVKRLSGRGFRVYRHHRIPPNDGGIALGQMVNKQDFRR